jgi:acetylornithine deacetylase/succinyl-diaminopimelate desuccinylase-like protein
MDPKTAPSRDSLLQYLREHEEKHLEELKDLLSIPSVSAQEKHKADCLRAAEWVAENLRASGVTARVEPTGGHPIVYGEWMRDPSAPTVLVYGHYDVQPPEPLGEWSSPPFDPTVRNGKLWARGATDDKGQMFTHLKAAEAHARVSGGPPLNVKYLIEGEEETSVANLVRYIETHREQLKADAAVVSDTAMYDPERPAITYSLRGIVYYQIDVRGPSHDLHSGVYGGAVANPAEVVSRILSSLKDSKSGRVKIPGFYDDVVRPSKEEKKNFKRLPFSDKEYRKELGVEALYGEAGWSTLERTWVRPTFEVNGVYGGYQGDGAKTVIPAEAHAKVSMRLVANQDPKKISQAFERAVQKAAPKGVRVTTTQLSASPAVRVPIDHPAIQAGMAALEGAFGKKPVFIAEGGSIPVVGFFQRYLGIPSVLIGYGLHDENLHAPNEHFDLGNFYAGIRASTLVLNELATRLASGPARAATKGRSSPR